MAPTSFWARRIHSLSGVVPIGAFLLEHFYSNSWSAQGQRAYNDYVEKLTSLPYVVFIEIFLIGLPIAFHAIYGLFIAWKGQVNGAPYMRNWNYVLQRATGIVLFVYIAVHVWETRIAAALHPAIKHDLFSRMHDLFTSPGYVVFYATGVACASFHLANGLWTFMIVWGITPGARGQRLASVACAGIGAVLFAMGIWSMVGFIRHTPVGIA